MVLRGGLRSNSDRVGRMAIAVALIVAVAVSSWGRASPPASAQSAATFVPPAWSSRILSTDIPPPPPDASLAAVSCVPFDDCVAVGDEFQADLPGQTEALTQTLSDGQWAASLLATPVGYGDLVLTGVSCPSVGSCVAVGTSSGDAKPDNPVVETLSAGTWTTTEPLAGTASYGKLAAVSCESASDCVAVGTSEDSNGNALGALILTLSGGVWSDTPPPAPPTGASTSWLAGISCPAAGSCVASGVYFNNAQLPLIDTLSNGVWSAAPPPLPAGSSTGDLQAVSCSSASSCVAVGEYTASSANGPLAETLSAGAWQYSTPPQTLPSRSSDLTGVSCVSSGCVAIGGHEFAEQLAASGWSESRLPLPAGATDLYPNAVSCSSADSCLGVGSETSGSGAEESALVETLGSSGWQPSRLVSPAGASESGTNAALNSVECPTTGTCLAVGSYPSANSGTSLPLVETLTSGTWTPSTPAGRAELLSVACSGPSACTSVGDNLVGSNDYQPAIETFDNGIWLPDSQPVLPSSANYALLAGVTCPSVAGCEAVGSVFDNLGPQSLGVGVDGYTSGGAAVLPSTGGTGVLLSITCPSGICLAAGAYFDGSGDPFPLVDAYDGKTWVQDDAVGFPTGAVDGEFTGISCTSPSACVAVGSYTDSLNRQHPMADVLSGTTWTSTSLPIPPGGGSAELNGVTCTAESCDAVGDYFDSFNIQRPLVDVIIGSSWTPTSPPLPSGTTGGLFNSVSCPSTCAAAGVASTGSGASVPLVSLSNAMPSPSVASVTPSSSTTTNATSVIIDGDNFTDNSHVYFGSRPASTLRVASATQIIATAPPSPVGTVDVEVVTPAGRSAPYQQ